VCASLAARLEHGLVSPSVDGDLTDSHRPASRAIFDRIRAPIRLFTVAILAIGPGDEIL
jgi:hypothetical protein